MRHAAILWADKSGWHRSLLQGVVEMNDTVQNRVPLLLWPFYAIWKLVTIILGVTGRIVCALLGIALMVAGMAISLTVIGAVLGVPLAAFGFLLTVRALF